MPKPSRTPRLSAPVPQFQIVVARGLIHGDVMQGRSSTGEPLCSFDLAVDDARGRCLIPISWRGVESPGLDHGDAVAVRGRVTKRFHRSGGATVVRTSVEVTEVVRFPRAASLARLIERAFQTGTT